jgi:hypothetical protein
MQLSNQNITAGDTRRYQVDYTPFLQDGDKLTSFTLAIAAQTPAATSSVGSNSFLDVSETQLYLFVTAGVVNENFTVKVQVKTSYGETVNDTISYTVVAA